MFQKTVHQRFWPLCSRGSSSVEYTQNHPSFAHHFRTWDSNCSWKTLWMQHSVFQSTTISLSSGGQVLHPSSSKNFLMRKHRVAFAKCSVTMTKWQRRERSLLSAAFYLFICLFLLWKNVHNTKFTVLTIFKYTVEGHYVHSHCRATIIILFQKFFALQNLNSAPVKQ